MEHLTVQRPPSHDNLRSVSVQDALGIERDVPDEWVEALKELVGKHLRTQLKMYVCTVCMHVCVYVYVFFCAYVYTFHL